MRIRDEHKEQIVKQKALELLVSQGFEGFYNQRIRPMRLKKRALKNIYFYTKR